uniref:Uncharacterized protein n=1 Tax=Myotis myotis TaxID=51298 RepID=A0A7J7ZWT6_MYOMY|nr:hypothetical protein mMyoMyo1_009677 [Myotis myotis]
MGEGWTGTQDPGSSPELIVSLPPPLGREGRGHESPLSLTWPWPRSISFPHPFSDCGTSFPEILWRVLTLLVTLGKSLPLSEHPFPHLSNRDLVSCLGYSGGVGRCCVQSWGSKKARRHSSPGSMLGSPPRTRSPLWAWERSGKERWQSSFKGSLHHESHEGESAL